MILPRLTSLVLPLVVACATKRDDRPGSSVKAADSQSVRAAAPVAESAHVAAAAPETSLAAARTNAPASKTVKPITPPATRCGHGLLNVTVRASALGASSSSLAATDSALRAESARILRPIAGLVTSIDVSPAIRAFRVHLVDTVSKRTVDRAMSLIRPAIGVEDVSSDDCSMHIEPAPTSVPQNSSGSSTR